MIIFMISYQGILINVIITSTTFPVDCYGNMRCSFSRVQKVIESCLIKWRRHLYGPPLHKTALLAVEDINCAICDDSGCNEPSELLRQWIDMGGWYDLDDLSFSRVISSLYLNLKYLSPYVHIVV